ncbi:hypothetical protein MCHI_003023, partial [Candidatus Magnetoovum chiemensis]
PIVYVIIKTIKIGIAIRFFAVFRLKTAKYMMMSFRSTIGPRVMKARWEADEKPVKEAATNASASEQTDSRIANAIIIIMDSKGLFP